jgi:hypothetical protein
MSIAGLPFDELDGLFGARTTGVHADHRDAVWSKFVRGVLRQRGDASQYCRRLKSLRFYAP